MIGKLLFSAVEQRILRPLDLKLATIIADSPAVMLASALLSRDVGQGHVCLPLSHLERDHQASAQIQACFAFLGKVNWLETLFNSNAVSKGNTITPLILSHERLYFHRMWKNELLVANFFSQENQLIPYDKMLLRHTLDKLFGVVEQEDLVNWQKIATAVALTRRITVISGGPGTGKTTTAAKLLAALIQTSGDQKFRIQLAAPTGKAAVRLTESITASLQDLPLTNAQKKYFPTKASTLHRLLGVQKIGHQPYYYRTVPNSLSLDILLVDEASMIDLIMMSRLIDALPKHARVIFLGDHDQLASVEAGSVLSDICSCASIGYTKERANELSKLTGYLLEGEGSSVSSMLRDSFCLLHKNYRFIGNSSIEKLSSAVKRGDYDRIKKIFNNPSANLRKIPLQTAQDYLCMLEEILQGYLCFLDSVQNKHLPEKALLIFRQFQLLCALREGPFGVKGLNERFEQLLFIQSRISRQSHSHWYPGRPIIISQNNSALGLFNGDIGITLDFGNGLSVWFQMPDGNLKSVQPSCLPAHETAWAITVHKAQGSEFNHVSLVLPPRIMPLVSRELIYTAITRARESFWLYITNDFVLKEAIATRTERQSGLNVLFSSV